MRNPTCEVCGAPATHATKKKSIYGRWLCNEHYYRLPKEYREADNRTFITGEPMNTLDRSIMDIYMHSNLSFSEKLDAVLNTTLHESTQQI